ncbi:MAG TPA: polyamine aminopropyltransferase, partial [Epsilonproteobacteria bacterium]|nr:polyamine aminopropyltransferase [Campylobacterota bacterium]
MKSKEVALLFGTFIIAICGLVYELLESTLSSYLLGDSIYHFSLIIGLFMSSMGVGAWLSRFVEIHLERAFVWLQMSIALVGGFSAFMLFYAFAYIGNYEAFLYLITILLGSMLGIEIPLIIRILKESFSLKTNISNVFTVDYVGALFAALLFPLVLVPQLGLMQTSFLFGGLNLIVGTMAWYIFKERLGKKYLLPLLLIATILVLGFVKSTSLTTLIENKLYQNNIIYSKQTPYQKL